MSSRHRQSRPGASNRVVPPRPARISANRRARHTAAAELREVTKGADPENLAETLPARDSQWVVPDGAPVARVGSKRKRHWKQPFWKRRTNLRRQRVTEELAVIVGD